MKHFLIMIGPVAAVHPSGVNVNCEKDVGILVHIYIPFQISHPLVEDCTTK